MNSKTAVPIAINTDTRKIMFLLPNSDIFQSIPNRNVNAVSFKCPYCKIILKSKQSFIHHITKSCEKKQHIAIHTKAKIELPLGETLRVIPSSQNERILITGVPNCGKSYFANEYTKSYHQMFPERRIFLITRLQNDDTLKKDEKLYTKIEVTNELLEDPFKLNDFASSLVIFDDIESSECPKATQAMYNLLDDICKNGRHVGSGISVLFLNQECRMGKRTKPILSMLSGLVIFPRCCSTYQTERLLKEHIGFSNSQIQHIFSLNSRWIYINRSCPMYVVHEHGAYMVGKEIY